MGNSKTKLADAIFEVYWICDLCGQLLSGKPGDKIMVCPNHGNYKRREEGDKIRYVAKVSVDLRTRAERDQELLNKIAEKCQPKFDPTIYR